MSKSTPFESVPMSNISSAARNLEGTLVNQRNLLQDLLAHAQGATVSPSTPPKSLGLEGFNVRSTLHDCENVARDIEFLLERLAEAMGYDRPKGLTRSVLDQPVRPYGQAVSEVGMYSHAELGVVRKSGCCNGQCQGLG